MKSVCVSRKVWWTATRTSSSHWWVTGQMKPVADSLTQYPFAQLHWHPKLIEAPGYILTIPMMKGPLSPFLRCHTPCYIFQHHFVLR